MKARRQPYWAARIRLWLTVSILWAMPVVGAAPKRVFALPSGNAETTLKQFVAQSGEQVVYLVSKVKGIRTNPVQGEFTPRDALQRLVANTVLTVVEDEKTGALMITRTSTPNRTSPPMAGPTPRQAN